MVPAHLSSEAPPLYFHTTRRLRSRPGPNDPVTASHVALAQACSRAIITAFKGVWESVLASGRQLSSQSVPAARVSWGAGQATGTVRRRGRVDTMRMPGRAWPHLIWPSTMRSGLVPLPTWACD
jgi:hypothetical protein